MPIIIPREGTIPPSSAHSLTQEQRDKMWEQIIRNWTTNNPDMLREWMKQEGENEPTEEE